MSFPDAGSLQAATDNVRAALVADPAKAAAAHRRWWDAHYRASFLSLPDTKLESFYWLQIYKYDCAPRPAGGVIATPGPSLPPSNWPYPTSNLTVQLSHYALPPGNHLHTSERVFHDPATPRDPPPHTPPT